MLQKNQSPALFKIVIFWILLPLIISGYEKANESPVFASKQMNVSTDGLYTCHEFIINDSSSWTLDRVLENPLCLKQSHHHNEILFHLHKKCSFITYTSNIGINYRYTSFIQTVILRI
jgi:hypothetical protein